MPRRTIVDGALDETREARVPGKALLLSLMMISMALAGCVSGDSGNQVLQQAGSSTVFPIAEAWAEEMSKQGIQVVAAGGGSGAGVSKLCAGEVDIGDLSRELKPSERQDCQANGIEPVVWQVAFDGITVAVNPENDWVNNLTVAELEHIWRPNDPAETWSDVREGWPDREIKLFGPDPDSGTYDYFVETILGEDTAPRQDYTPSTDDNVLVEGVAQSKGALGYFGFAYYDENRDRLKAVPIQDGQGPAVTPSLETIGDGSYSPLSRPLFMVTDGVPQPGSNLHTYFEYAMTDGQALVSQVGYVPLDDATLEEQRARLGGGSAS